MPKHYSRVLTKRKVYIVPYPLESRNKNSTNVGFCRFVWGKSHHKTFFYGKKAKMSLFSEKVT